MNETKVRFFMSDDSDFIFTIQTGKKQSKKWLAELLTDKHEFFLLTDSDGTERLVNRNHIVQIKF